MDKLAEVFNRHLTHAHYNVMSQIHNTRMSQGVSVMDHIMKMINLFEKLKYMGMAFNLLYKTNVILNSLPTTCAHFCMSYNISNKDLELTELANVLVEAEKTLKDNKLEVNTTDAKPYSKGKRRKRIVRGKP
ncbi:uncharacterized protein LOC122672266 [Telopea speciosissima]|uniref:uncharacterized protein LOC122672266 n=1 Tax=Telopea speciosissima TaxID=54955 RepID=UPI001CC4DC8A|nr:uncharacterized protein LOC122672266 [Telopea speciosissima]